MILALDPANETGFAVGTMTAKNTLSIASSGSWVLTSPRVGHPGDRLLLLYRHMQDVCLKYAIDLIAYEDATMGSHHAHVQARHNELRGVILLFGAVRKVPCVAYNPRTIKKFATDNGNADKTQMIRALETHYGIRTDNSNVADAVFILSIAAHGIRPSQPSRRRSVKRRPRRLF